ncbi:MAG: hypothetical protein HZB99_03730 [Candidatus Harrisonbacteria bacterium]|nr:hypothetical protein [Candidatus Harrisonbacteria bacterium]
MERIGFRKDEPVTPTFKLNKQDLKDPVFKANYPEVAGSYRLISIWPQGEEVAFWAQEDRSGTELFLLHKEEVNFLAKRKKFKKS